MSQDMRQLITKLGPASRSSLEKAASACLAATHFTVELEHFLLQLLQPPAADVAPILKYYEIDQASVEKDLRKALEGLKRGNARTPSLSPRLLEAFEQAWLITSIDVGGTQLRSGTILLAILTKDTTRAALLDSCPLLLKIPREHLAENLKEFLKQSPEDAAEQQRRAPGAAAEGEPVKKGGALDQYTTDMTALAKSGKLDPIHGRDAEIRQLVDILMRRRQNNPILTGEPGVGKTAVVEGLAQRIAAGDVPEALKTVVLRGLDIGLLQAGAGLKGEFEQRLKNVIAEVAAAPVPVILFVDEAHTLIGAGGSAGQGDAANLLKPALARGELRTIAATTWAEYKRYFEKDPALARRFQVVKVGEPADDAACIMVRGVASRLEAHHGVRVTDAAIEAAVKLSSRYVTGRQQPDKALSVLDTAAARVAVARDATPAALEAVIRRLAAVGELSARLEREAEQGVDHGKRLAGLNEEVERLRREQQELEDRWQAERAPAAKIRALLEKGKLTDGDRDELVRLRGALTALQGEEPMVPVEVDDHVVADVIAAWTGIPVGRMMRDDLSSMLAIEERLGGRVIGQDQALGNVAQRLRTYHAGMAEPGKPVGVFLFCGPSGVGKTETALALADLMYGGDRGLTTINMSEYQEPHTVALLKGSPPGYVGYGQGGVLTEAVRRMPYSVVLLDEIEKAHPDVTDLFYQVFDKGMLEDAEGTEVDFKNTLVVMTTNLGAERIQVLSPADAEQKSAEALANAIRPDLLKRFKPAFLARCTIVPYFPLGEAMIQRIIELKLDRLRARLAESHGAVLELDAEVERAILARAHASDGGARMIDHILGGTLLPDLSTLILTRLAQGEPFDRVVVGIDANGAMTYRFAFAEGVAA
jgi:type VI secretion system protein VasG